ncbi:MAG: hypothetical protein U0547_06855 [Dehalococcoidia bacterium]
MTGNGSKRSEARVRWQVPVGAASLCLALGGLGLLLNSGGGSLPKGIEPDAVAAALTEARTVPANDHAYVLAPSTAFPSAEAQLTEEPTLEPTPESRVMAASSGGVRSLPPPPPTATPTPVPPTPTPTTPTAVPTATVPTVEPTAAPSTTPDAGTPPGPGPITTHEPGPGGIIGGGPTGVSAGGIIIR